MNNIAARAFTMGNPTNSTYLLTMHKSLGDSYLCSILFIKWDNFNGITYKRINPRTTFTHEARTTTLPKLLALHLIENRKFNWNGIRLCRSRRRLTLYKTVNIPTKTLSSLTSVFSQLVLTLQNTNTKLHCLSGLP